MSKRNPRSLRYNKGSQISVFDNKITIGANRTGGNSDMLRDFYRDFYEANKNQIKIFEEFWDRLDAHEDYARQYGTRTYLTNKKGHFL